MTPLLEKLRLLFPNPLKRGSELYSHVDSRYPWLGSPQIEKLGTLAEEACLSSLFLFTRYSAEVERRRSGKCSFETKFKLTDCLSFTSRLT